MDFEKNPLDTLRKIYLAITNVTESKTWLRKFIKQFLDKYHLGLPAGDPLNIGGSKKRHFVANICHNLLVRHMRESCKSALISNVGLTFRSEIRGSQLANEWAKLDLYAGNPLRPKSRRKGFIYVRRLDNFKCASMKLAQYKQYLHGLADAMNSLGYPLTKVLSDIRALATPNQDRQDRGEDSSMGESDPPLISVQPTAPAKPSTTTAVYQDREKIY